MNANEHGTPRPRAPPELGLGTSLRGHPVCGPDATLGNVKINALQTGALLAALAVALGAFGAHALKTRLEPAMLANFETGVRYQMYAALALMVLDTQPGQTRAPLFILLGALIFSVSLYLLSTTGVRWLGAVTPIGGVLLIAGLVLAALDAR